jgi:hypothetical protein
MPNGRNSVLDQRQKQETIQDAAAGKVTNVCRSQSEENKEKGSGEDEN